MVGVILFGEVLLVVVVLFGNELGWVMLVVGEVLLVWLCDCYDVGSLLVGCEEGVLLLVCVGVLVGWLVWLFSLDCCVVLKVVVFSWLLSECMLVDDGDLFIVVGIDVWKYLSLCLFVWVYGYSVMLFVF